MVQEFHLSIQPGLQKQPGPENQLVGGWGRTEDCHLTLTPPQCYSPHPGRNPVLSVPYSPSWSLPFSPSQGKLSEEAGCSPQVWLGQGRPPTERRGGTAPWEGVLCQLWVRACRDFWKRWAWGRRESCREGGGGGDSARPRPLIWAPAEGVGSSGLPRPHLHSLGSWQGWPRATALAAWSWGSCPLWMQPFHPLGLSLFISKVETIVTPPPPNPRVAERLTKAPVQSVVSIFTSLGRGRDLAGALGLEPRGPITKLIARGAAVCPPPRSVGVEYLSMHPKHPSEATKMLLKSMGMQLCA